jgi:hypothetical protein
MSDINQKISTTVSFDTSQAQAKAKELEKAVDRLSDKAEKIRVGGGIGGGGSSPAGGGGRTGGIGMPNTDLGKTFSDVFSISNQGLGKLMTGISGGFMRVLGPVGMIASALWSAASSFVSVVWDGLKFAGELAMGLGKTLLIGAGAFAAAVAGGIYAAHKLLSPAAEAERYKAQLGVFGKSDKLDEYKKVAEEGPQDLGQVVRAGISLESYGLDSSKYMKVVQDAASTFGRDMSEVAGILSRAKSGSIEIDQMNMVGLTKADLMAQGVKYDKDGGIADESKAGLEDKVAAAMNSKYAGMALSMSKTYEGAISNLFDSIKVGMENTFKGILPYATAFVMGITEVTKGIGDSFAKIDWKGAGEQLVTLWDNAAGIINSIDWVGIGNTFATIVENVLAVTSTLLSAEGWSALGNTMLGILDTAWQGLKSVAAEAFSLLLSIVQWATSPNTWGAALGIVWESLKITVVGLIKTLSTVLEQILFSILRGLWTLTTSFIALFQAAWGFAMSGLEKALAKLPIPGAGKIIGAGSYTSEIGNKSFREYGKGIREGLDESLSDINPYKHKTNWEWTTEALGNGSIDNSGKGVVESVTNTFRLIQDKLNAFASQAVANGKNPEATAKIETEKAERARLDEAKRARTEQSRIDAMLKEMEASRIQAEQAAKAANSLQSQLLQEMRHMNEYNTTDMAASMMW